jgi:hypothetical protein
LGHTHGECEAWNSIFCKASLRHEVEESIVALHHLQKWMSSSTRGDDSKHTKLTVVDICCGKGFFSMLLSYMVGNFWQDCGIANIVLIDKATGINWQYIDVANETATAENRPLLTLWKGVNLHEYDDVLDRLLGLQTTLALVGIHLCKNLSPAAVSLVHGLGREKCPYMLLAPCCLPRSITSKSIKSSGKNLRVYQYEDPLERSKRLVATKQRNRALGKGRKGICYLCSSTTNDHRVRDCHVLKGTSPVERKAILHAACLLLPCWQCGEVGHQKADCLVPAMPTKEEPPSRYYNVASISTAPQPFAQYCQVLGTALRQDDDQHGTEDALTVSTFSNVVIHETGLTNTDSAHEQDPSQEGDWTKGRKSIYIVATTSN